MIFSSHKSTRPDVDTALPGRPTRPFALGGKHLVLGNPIESEEDFRRIAGYAPYEQIQAQGYPPILALAGLTDPRVTYWEPAKWVAKLRSLYRAARLRSSFGVARQVATTAPRRRGICGRRLPSATLKPASRSVRAST